MIKLIVAIGPEGLIGIGNKMAWHIPEEFAHFKKYTLGHTLLFGKNTFLGLPGKLPNRKCFVLSDETIENADLTIKSKEELNQIFTTYRNNDDILYIAGGKSIYEQFYKEADELIISKVRTDVKGDVFLKLDLTEYDGSCVEKHEKFDVWIYKKRK